MPQCKHLSPPESYTLIVQLARAHSSQMLTNKRASCNCLEVAALSRPHPHRIRIEGPVEVQVEEATNKRRKKRSKVIDPDHSSEDERSRPQILMVRTENVVHERFEQTQEIKVRSRSSSEH